MTRDHPVEVPFIDSRNGPIEPRTVLVRIASAMPDEPLLALSVRIGQGTKKFGQNAGHRGDTSLAELFIGGVIEYHICLDEGAGWLVVENELLVGMGRDIFIIKLRVELWVDGYLLVRSKNDAEGNIFVLLLGSLFGKPFWANNFGLRISSMPWSKVDVMLLYISHIFMRR